MELFLTDARQGNCYTTLSHSGLCRNKLSMRLSKKDCCCGMNMGKGWGDNCEICPKPGEGKEINYNFIFIKYIVYVMQWW